MTVVADTSALISLGCVDERSLLGLLCAEYDVLVPKAVETELEETSTFGDEHGAAAQAVLDRTTEMEVETVGLDEDFPLDDGENAAVTLSNKRNAEMLLCDEFNKIGIIHASLTSATLVTSPKFLLVLAENDHLSNSEVKTLLGEITRIRSWTGNSYVERVRERL